MLTCQIKLLERRNLKEGFLFPVFLADGFGSGRSDLVFIVCYLQTLPFQV